jgi:thiamine phosphate synthase YjbQ (UPF0047 family)
MAVHTVTLTIQMAGGTQIENVTKSVVDAVAEAKFQAGIETYHRIRDDH